MMLSTATAQYLHPDYLQPLPTTLDAKKSPLALLAQTCSSIGKDTTPNKPIIPPLEKKSSDSKSESPSAKPGSADGRKSQTSNAGEREKRETSPNSDKSSFRAPHTKEMPPLVPISSDRKSPSEREGRSPKSPSTTSRLYSPGTASGVSNSRISLNCGTLSLEVNHHEASASGLSKPSLTTASTTTTSSVSAHHKLDSLHHPSVLPPSMGLPGCGMPAMLGHPLALDPATASHIYSAGLTGHGALPGLAGGHKPGHMGTSPYVAYARVKTATGASTLVPICRDPYCTNCQVTMHNAQLTGAGGGGGGCGAGCTQCTHEKSLSAVPPTSISTSMGSMPILSLGATSLTAAAGANHLASSLYSHAYGLGHHGLPPYVCNWVAGSDYCGKRYSTSEELLQHLRTHTSSSDSSAMALAAGLSPYPNLALAAAPSLAACHAGHYSTPGSISPNSLRQAYSRSISPNTLLAASRYHPYKSPLAAALPAPPTATLPGLPAGLGAYYPYSLYGQRLGPAVTP